MPVVSTRRLFFVQQRVRQGGTVQIEYVFVMRQTRRIGQVDVSRVVLPAIAV